MYSLELAKARPFGGDAVEPSGLIYISLITTCPTDILEKNTVSIKINTSLI